MDKGKLRLGAVSGTAEDRPEGPEDPGGWRISSSGSSSPARTSRSPRSDDGKIHADRPETEEKFRAFFAETGFRSFYALLLKDEEGKLGVLAFESGEAARLRRRDARPARDPRQPGDRRGPQRAALQAGSAGRLLEAARREAPEVHGDPEAPPARLGHRRSPPF